MGCRLCSARVTLSLGVFLIVAGALLNVYWRDAFISIVSPRFVLTNTSKTYDAWAKTSVPVYMNFYFFNWTNPSHMKETNYVPVFKELGPYRFLEKIEKVDIVWNDNGTVSHRRVKRWYFDPEGSNGTLDDRITTVNVVTVSAVRMIPSGFSVIAGFAFASLHEIYITRTAGEFLFEGYEDPILNIAKKWPTFADKIPYTRFGWFYMRNGSSTNDGVFNLNTGANGMQSFGQINTWNNKNHTGNFREHCGDVVGSAGEFWPPKRTKEESIKLFTPDLGRYIDFRYCEEVTVNGFTGYKYDAGPFLVDNGTLDPSNLCFTEGESVPPGALNVTKLRHGAPVFLSYPHFNYADESYFNTIRGLKPNPKQHSIYITLEPNFGIPLEVQAGLQVNFLVKPTNTVSLLTGVPEVFFPVLWFQQKVRTPPEKLALINLLLTLIDVGSIISLVILIVGLVCVLGTSVYIIKYRNQETLKITHRRATYKAEVVLIGENGKSINGKGGHEAKKFKIIKDTPM